MVQYAKKIEQMIKKIKNYGFTNQNVFNALRQVPRHLFVLPSDLSYAYSDTSLPIGHGQTISQPYTVAIMLDAIEIKEGMNILEIGSGSGYNTALLKVLVGSKGKVTSIEYLSEMAEFALNNLKKLNLKVELINNDGSLGYITNAPYDRIIITCACPDIPLNLIDQLKDKGIILTPVGSDAQIMIKGVKEDSYLKTTSLGVFRFVKMQGINGF